MLRRIGNVLVGTVFFTTLVAFGCGGSGSGSGGSSSATSDGAVMFGQSCVECHDSDGADIDDPTSGGISAAIDDPATGMGALKGEFSADELQALVHYLTTLEHSNDWRDKSNHGAFADDEGVSSCESCHGGPALTGDGEADSCFRCHGKKW